jgi:hypothetical protein
VNAAARERAAINAGFWFTKDHGRWFVGRGSERTRSGPYATRTAARAAMIAAWEAAGSPGAES